MARCKIGQRRWSHAVARSQLPIRDAQCGVALVGHQCPGYRCPRRCAAEVQCAIVKHVRSRHQRGDVRHVAGTARHLQRCAWHHFHGGALQLVNDGMDSLHSRLSNPSTDDYWRDHNVVIARSPRTSFLTAC